MLTSKSRVQDQSSRSDDDSRARLVARVAVLTALIVVLTLVPGIYLFGGAVPITLQTLAVTLAATLLGPRHGVAAVLTYLALIAVGLPVASGFRGGLGVFAGPTGGFLVGFVPMVLVVGWLARLALRSTHPVMRVAGLWAAGVVGIPVLYAVGVPWLSQVANLPLGTAMATMMPFVVGDAGKAGVAAFVTAGALRALPGVVDRWT